MVILAQLPEANAQNLAAFGLHLYPVAFMNVRCLALGATATEKPNL